MAFQAGGAHALDRALEAIAYSWTEMTRTPTTALWEKPTRGEPLLMQKTFTVVPRGLALVIGCNTFPTWNSWPGLFASLVCGNPVVVKPHPSAVLPLAITVQVCQQVLEESGFDPHLVTLAAEGPDDKLAATLAVRPEVRLIDYTGGNAFGDWLEDNARQATVFAEKAGVNAVILDSTSSFAAMCHNLAFSFALYTGQMCTAPQNVYLPADGIETDEGHKSVADVGAGLSAAFDKLLGDDARAVELLGGVVNDGVLERLEAAASQGEVLVESRVVTHPSYPDATVRTPTVIGLTSADAEVYENECFGPVAYLVATSGTDESIRIFQDTVRRQGAMTASVYSTSDGRARRGSGGGPRRRRRPVREPARRRLRQPVRVVLRLPRHRRQPRRQRLVHRRRVRRLAVPDRAVAPSRLRRCHSGQMTGHMTGHIELRAARPRRDRSALPPQHAQPGREPAGDRRLGRRGR